ncbi:GNAT family N-acetyltransferase [Sphingobium algorifonticola]|uniref:GNAT family N-acetyltransferase n=1 Tax=Sphingobium algorifonticola TaxID=2008318 RepID=A0A437J6U9_9SPHN|nr:GNAT family N-acetyltransferase [Sphingobium algorifonticola]RVT40902.1 GNAT family N-acetyltransferase [Sphingobium algorifonticola]
MAADSPLVERWEYRSFVEAWRHAARPLDRDRQACLFDRFTWMELLHRHCMPDTAPHILSARLGDAQGWLFLTESRQRQLGAMANWYSFAFRPQFSGANDPATRYALTRAMAAQLLATTARIDLYPIEEADDRTMLCDALRAAGWFVTARPLGTRHVLNLDGRDFATYWAMRPGPLRTLVRRKARSTALAFSIHHAMSDALWRDYLHVYDRSWKDAEPYYPFLRALAEQEAAAGTLRLGFARTADGVPVAAQFWTIENAVALIHKLAHDAALDAQSPGTLLSHHMFRAAIDDDRVSRIDYGTGDNGYKADWMERRIALYRIDAYNPRFAGSWLPAARGRISTLVADRWRR